MASPRVARPSESLLRGPPFDSWVAEVAEVAEVVFVTVGAAPSLYQRLAPERRHIPREQGMWGV